MRVVIIMGVSGTGKTTVGNLLATDEGLGEGWFYVDGDEYHSEENKRKMAAGIALQDEDREDWLRALRRLYVGPVAHKGEGMVLGCSALKKSYRDFLRGVKESIYPGSADRGAARGLWEMGVLTDGCPEPEEGVKVFFVFLQGEESLIRKRMEARHHFFRSQLLRSQFETLEDPTGEEGVVVVELAENKSPEDEAMEAAKLLHGLRMW